MRNVQDLIMQRLQSTDAVISFANFQGLKEIDHGMSNSEILRRGHFFDPMRMKVRIQQILKVLPRYLSMQNIMNHFEEVMVSCVEQKTVK